MSNVPKSQQKESDFETSHHLYNLRDEITRLTCNSFGFSKEKYQKQIEKFREWHKNDPKCNEIVAGMEAKCEAFNDWFITEERTAILDMLRMIQTEFSVGNSIFPSETPARLLEFLVRRYHMNRAIGYCFALKQEIQYVIRVLPVDINRYEHLSKAIDKQVALLKGVRQADNRLIRPIKNRKTGTNKDTLDRDIIHIFDGIASAILKIGRLEAIRDPEAEETKPTGPKG